MVKNSSEIIDIAASTLKQEAQAIERLVPFLNQDFADAVQAIYHSKGRFIITGIGKSAIIAQKIVATLNSTGTPSVFMHAADAIHGDLGIILQDDIVMMISKSGNTPEISALLPLIKSNENQIIALTGNVNSYLAKQADFVLNCSVIAEACPNNLAPTASSTAQLALGDALSVCLLSLRQFSAQDFAKFHPGGILGKKLYTKVADLLNLREAPQVDIHADIKTVIIEISSKRLGATAVLKGQKLMGIITDGDLRRMMESHEIYHHLKAEDIMSKQPKTVKPDVLATVALDQMKSLNITGLIVTDDHETYLGFIHLHDILKEGIV